MYWWAFTNILKRPYLAWLLFKRETYGVDIKYNRSNVHIITTVLMLSFIIETQRVCFKGKYRKNFGSDLYFVILEVYGQHNGENPHL